MGDDLRFGLAYHADHGAEAIALTAQMQPIVDALAAASTVSLGGLGLLIVMRSSGVVHFVHGAIFTAAAYSAFILYRFVEFPFLASIMLGVLLSAALGATIEFGIYRFLRSRLASRLVLFIASLGLYIVIENALALVFGSQVRSIRTWEIVEGWRFGGMVITPVQVIAVLCAMLAVALLIFLQKRSHFGRQTRAVWSDPELAMSMGLPLERIRTIAVLGGSALAGMAGILVACDTDIYPGMGLNPLMVALVAVIVGGNRIEGVALGALVIGLAQHVSVIWLPIRWQNLIVFAMLVFFLVARPQGFLGKPLRRAAV